MYVLSAILMRFRALGWTAALVAVAALIALAGLLAAPAAGPPAQAQSTGYKEVSAGWFHTCALRLDGGVDCWGRNAEAELTPPASVTFVQISAGGYHTCGLKQDGQVKCWGRNDLGQDCFSGGCLPIYGGQIDVPAGVLFSQVSAGVLHTCGLTLEGNIDCWGDNEHGEATDQMGLYIAVSAGDAHTCGLKSDNTVVCWGDNANGRAGNASGPFTQLSAGGSHNCAVRLSDPPSNPPTGLVDCWGGDGYGQSSPPFGLFSEVSAGNLHTCGLRSDQSLNCWGYNFYGQVGKTPGGWFKQVDSGQGHSCAITLNNAVVCWGRNDWGQANVPAVGGPPPVSYDFAGFYPPVKPEPEVNVVKGGSTVPLKFSLGGDEGLEVIAPDSPASQQVDCTSFNAKGALEPVQPAGGSRLSYDPVSNQYAYVWKTEKAWAGTCRVLVLRLVDETEHLVAFKFR